MNPVNAIITHSRPARQDAVVPPSGGIRLALIAGLLLWLANPPAGLWPLAWIAVAPLIISVVRARHIRQAAWRGYLFGWAFLAPTWHWVGITISSWMNGSPLGWIALFGLTFILAGFYGAFGAAGWWLWRNTRDGWRIVALAAAWTIVEWLRSLGPLGMPWAQVSYTQARFLPVIQIAEFTGAYGVSFLVLIVNAGFAHWWEQKGQPGARRYAGTAIFAAFLVMFFGWVRMAQPERGSNINVVAMQGNFKMHETEEDVRNNFKLFFKQTQKASLRVPNPRLIVWSESAAPRDAINDPDARSMMETLVTRYKIGLMVGSRVGDNHGGETNSSLLFPPQGGKILRYDKRQLVPFGEYIPFREWIPKGLADTFQFFPVDVTRGTGSALMEFTDSDGQNVKIGPFICYEAMYPQYARNATRDGAELLVTQSNDAWFHSNPAMEQHLASVILRAVENRRFVVRSTVNGITCILDSHGLVMAKAPLDTVALLTSSVVLRHGLSVYTRFGDWFIGLSLLLICYALFLNSTMNQVLAITKSPDQEIPGEMSEEQKDVEEAAL